VEGPVIEEDAFMKKALFASLTVVCSLLLPQIAAE